MPSSPHHPKKKDPITPKKKETMIDISSLDDDKLKEAISEGLHAGRPRYEFPQKGEVVTSVFNAIQSKAKKNPISRDNLEDAIVDGFNAGGRMSEMKKDYDTVREIIKNIQNAGKSIERY